MTISININLGICVNIHKNSIYLKPKLILTVNHM